VLPVDAGAVALLVDAGAVVLLVDDGRFQLDHADFPHSILSV